MKRLSSLKSKIIIICKNSEERSKLFNFFAFYEIEVIGKVFPFSIDPHIEFDGLNKKYQTICKESLGSLKSLEKYNFRNLSLT